MWILNLTFTFLLFVGSYGACSGAPIGQPALTDIDDVVRFDLTGGLTSPSPGVHVQGTALWTVRPSDAFGVTTGYAKHELVTENAKFSAVHVDAIWEHTWALLGGYNAIRLRGGLGLARAHRAMDRNAASISGDDASRIYWGGHVSAGAGIDFPVADLMWARAGCLMQKVFLERTPTQVAVFGGIVWGGQWFGIGD